MTGNALISAVATLAILCVPLAFWRGYFETTDWAAVALIFLAVPVAVGHYIIAVGRRRAIMKCALTTGSRYHWLAGGRLYAFVQSAALTLASISTLGFQALYLPLHEGLFLAAVVLVTVVAFWWLVGLLGRDLSEPFGVAAAGRLTVVLVGLTSVTIYYFVIRQYRTFPGELKLPFPEAMLSAMESAPERESFLVEIVTYAAMLDAAPAWLVVRLDQYPIVGYLFASYLALVCLLLASAAVAIAVFYKQYATKGVSHDG